MATAVGTLTQARIRGPEAGHQNAAPHGKDHNLHRVRNRTVNECEWKYVDQTVSARTSPSLRRGIAFSWKYQADLDFGRTYMDERRGKAAPAFHGECRETAAVR